MNIQALKPFLKGFFGLVAIVAAANLVNSPANAQMGDRTKPLNTPTSQPPTVTPDVPTAPTITTPDAPTAPAPNTTEPTVRPQPAASSKNIVDIASSNRSFKTLTKALKAAGLGTALSGQGPYTVFAPTDEAFAALPKGTLEALLKPENKEKLRKVLAYHVLAGSVDSTTLKAGQVQTVEGSPVNVSVSNGEVMVNDARVTTPDIKASNGVIHVINKVILPPDM